MTNSSTDSYPAASAHFCARSSRSPSIFTLCEPNIYALHSTELPHAEHRLPHHTFAFCDAKFPQDCRRYVGQSGRLGRDLAIAQQHARNLSEIHAVIAAPRVGIVLKYVS